MMAEIKYCSPGVSTREVPKTPNGGCNGAIKALFCVQTVPQLSWRRGESDVFACYKRTNLGLFEYFVNGWVEEDGLVHSPFEKKAVVVVKQL